MYYRIRKACDLLQLRKVDIFEYMKHGDRTFYGDIRMKSVMLRR